jgi:hypothetical protein
VGAIAGAKWVTILLRDRSLDVDFQDAGLA